MTNGKFVKSSPKMLKNGVIMLDFYKINESHNNKTGQITIFPDFINGRSRDLMVQGGVFYAVWDAEAGLWSTDENRVVEIIDEEIAERVEALGRVGMHATPRFMRYEQNRLWSKYRSYLSRRPDSFVQLDRRVAFQNTVVSREDYISKRLPYSLTPGVPEAFNEMFDTLYDEANLLKIKWAIGSIVAGDSINIQKFYVLYGAPGTGKSTLLNLLNKLFEGYSAPIDTEALVRGATFALEPLKNNPLIAYDHEGDMSKLTTNTILNSVVSHDRISINAKYRGLYSLRMDTVLFLATNKPVRITDKKSGLLRRMIDISPTGVTLPERDYDRLVSLLDFELGMIANDCLDVYNQLGRNYYNDYIATEMLERTNPFYNFIYDNSIEFKREEFITLSVAWQMYKQYCDDVGLTFKMNRNAFRDEFREYWHEFHKRKMIDGTSHRSVYIGFRQNAFEREYRAAKGEEVEYDWLELGEKVSILDRELADQPAQTATENGTPKYSWDNNTIVLGRIDTTKLHYVLPPKNMIVVDFDIRDENGRKSLAKNIEAARSFPHTYAEVSKSGQGLHLHYYYDGDIDALSRIFDLHIEIIKPIGKTSIRRRLTVCNDHPIATISSGLPLKPTGDHMVSKKTVASERTLRMMILKNLNKEYHPATKPSVMFIDTILKEAFDAGLRYDVTDMKPAIIEFASNSTNNKDFCLQMASEMKYQSDHEDGEVDEYDEDDTRLVFFDLEVFPNLLYICWKYEGSDEVIHMINPTTTEVDQLLRHRLVGFNNRRYDNHILYARLLGYDNRRLFEISSRIVRNDRTAYFREAYGLSYTDVYDFSSIKQSLKKWQVELGLIRGDLELKTKDISETGKTHIKRAENWTFHMELDLPWDEPAPEEKWEEIGKYCENDTRSTEQVFLARIEDYHAREILAELSGLRVNDSTQRHAAKIIFGYDTYADKHKEEFVYPNLALEFPGYTFTKGKSYYRGEEPGEGGYVYAEPGIYHNVIYLDIASMHPTSLEVMNLFGKYTKNFSDLKSARIAIKEGKLDDAREMFDGKLVPYLKHPEEAKGLSYALKIILNSVYGFTAARFDNPFRDDRNVDNVVAKRGALFMIDLKNALQEQGIKPIHFKTDSVKIADYTEEDVIFVREFGKKYGYDFGVEGVFQRMVLINDAVLVGKWDDGSWEAVGARFAQPYVFKTLFSKEAIEFNDMVETRSVVKGDIYLEDDSGTMTFIGRIGSFCPMAKGGGTLYRVLKDKKYAVTGTKGYKWLPSEVVRQLKLEDDIDLSYFNHQLEETLEKISEFGDPTQFIE